MKKKVIVICGGGVFGYIPAKLLAGTKKTREISEIADAIGGTSIGGILALMLGYGYNTREVLEKFTSLVGKAFKKSFWRSFYPWGAKFDGKGLEAALEELFKSRRFGDLGIPTIIPTLDFEHNKPKVFDNIIKDTDNYAYIRDIARMTSAAPTYFPPKSGKIDGGLLANNPVIETVIALKSKLDIPFSEMDVLVLGTGVFPKIERDMEEVASWSAISWLKPMLTYLTKANEMRSDFIASQLGLNSYTIYNPIRIDPAWDMSDASLIPMLDRRIAPFQRDFNDAFEKFLSR